MSEPSKYGYRHVWQLARRPGYDGLKPVVFEKLIEPARTTWTHRDIAQDLQYLMPSCKSEGAISDLDLRAATLVLQADRPVLGGRRPVENVYSPGAEFIEGPRGSNYRVVALVTRTSEDGSDLEARRILVAALRDFADVLESQKMKESGDP